MADGVREPDEGVNAAGVRAGVATNRAQEAADESRKGERDPVAPDAPAALTSVSVREPDEATIREAFNLMECRDSWSGSWCSQRREAGLAALDRLVADRDTATERYAVVRHAYAIEAQARGAAEAEVAVLTARLEAAEKQRCDYDCNRFEGGL